MTYLDYTIEQDPDPAMDGTYWYSVFLGKKYIDSAPTVEECEKIANEDIRKRNEDEWFPGSCFSKDYPENYSNIRA